MTEIQPDIMLDLRPDELAFLADVRRFASEYVAPNSRKWEEDEAFAPDIWQKVGAVGLTAVTLPTSFGGRGFSTLLYCEVIREIAKADPALAMNLAAANALALGHIVEFGNKEQVDKYVSRVASGEISMAWALTEPHAGSDAKQVATRGVPIEGKPGYAHLNGEKMFITNGGRAELIVVIARDPQDVLTAYLMETDQPGFQLIDRLRTVSVSASNTVHFKLENAVGWHTPCTFADAIGMLQRGRLGIGGMALGIAQRAHELTIEYSKQRSQFNRRLADMQSVQNMIADSEMDIAAAWLLIVKGCKLYDKNLPCMKEASMAKLFASEAANRVTNRAIQIHGGRGMLVSNLVEKLWRDAKLTEIGEGSSEIQRLVIAKQALG